VTVPSREDRLVRLKAEYLSQLQPVRDGLASGHLSDPQGHCDHFHQAAVNYLNEFDRTLDEYTLPEFGMTSELIQRKREDALNIVDPIVVHWKILRRFCEKFSLHTPEPSETAYASLQRVLKHFYPERVKEIAEKFREAKLPVYGFEDQGRHSGWKMKGNSIAPLVVGAICLGVALYLGFAVVRPSGFQYFLMRLFATVGAAGLIVAVIAGTAKLTWSIAGTLTLTATGGLAVFFAIYYFNPPPPPNPEPASAPPVLNMKATSP
jgi:hypothetical protein